MPPLLSAYGQALQPKPTAPRTEQEQQLAELIRRRVQVLEILVAQRQQGRTPPSLPALRRKPKASCAAWNVIWNKFEARLRDLRAQGRRWMHASKKLEAITGVGTLTALGVLAELPELGTLNRRQGSGPGRTGSASRESGQWHGRRSIGGGRAPVRRALYMAALVAARSNRQLKEFYQRLRR